MMASEVRAGAGAAVRAEELEETTLALEETQAEEQAGMAAAQAEVPAAQLAIKVARAVHLVDKVPRAHQLRAPMLVLLKAHQARCPMAPLILTYPRTFLVQST